MSARRAAALARHYREQENLSIAGIARRLGRAEATVKAYLYDPTGVKAQVKARYQGVCRGCGAPTAARGGKGDAYQYCKRCHPGAIAPTRTREWVREATRCWRGRYGSPPSSTDGSRTHARRRGGEALKRLRTGIGRRPRRSSTCTPPGRRRGPTPSQTTEPKREGACAARPGTCPARMAEHLANHDEPPERDDGWQDLAVANPTFLLERLGSECGDLQFLRELTVNGLDAIAANRIRQGPLCRGPGLAASGGLRRQGAQADGDRHKQRNAPTSLKFINQWVASSREQSHTANFGVGAKVAAVFRKPARTSYTAPGTRGRARWCASSDTPTAAGTRTGERWENGHSDFWRPLDEQDKPWLLRGQDHGTQVVLLDQHARHDTTQALESVTDTRRHWITRYLNARFLHLPSHVEVLVREQHGRDEPGQLRHVHGEQHHLERHAIAAGAVRVERRARALVGTRRGSSRPPPRSRDLGLDRSRRRRARR